MPPRNRDPSTGLSKTLSWLLRHGAHETGLKLTPDGFAKVSDILHLPHPQFRRTTEAEIREIVAKDPKGRYSLKEHDGELLICANQGHSIQLESPVLRPITSVEECPQAIHGTYKRFLDSILAGGLKPMSRTHIHFSKVEPVADREVSGIRPSCEILIYLDVAKTLADGIPLLESLNCVILSPGNVDGCIPKDYFLKIIERK